MRTKIPAVRLNPRGRELLLSRMVRLLECRPDGLSVSWVQSEMVRYYADRTHSHDMVRGEVRALIKDPRFELFNSNINISSVRTVLPCQHPKCRMRWIHNR